MPTHDSAKKRMRQNPKRRERNQRVRSRLTTFTRKFTEALESGDLESADELIRTVESEYDRAVSKGVIPKKRASRKVSRLHKRLNKAKDEG
ncbi:MAG: 30S ribosomal protein S20 [Persicimonas sp.]